MSLLPKSSEEFSSKEYWNEFFSKRGKESFEWYGEFTQLYGVLLKYSRPKNKILISGCGNSTLSGELYKVGYNNITNVDVSEVVIRQMSDKYKKDYPYMEWLHGDMLNLKEIQSETFDCVIDKGTLDALISSPSEESAQKAELYFKEINRIMKVLGRYICISLLQEHILRSLSSWFSANGWAIRFCRCEEAEKSQLEKGLFCLPVFAVVCTKFKQTTTYTPVIELDMGDGITKRVESCTEVSDYVSSLQSFAMTRHTLKKKNLGSERRHIDLWEAKSGQTRFTLYVVDNIKTSNKLCFAVFIVPQGREVEWLFASADGQRQLADTSKSDRLVVVHLKRDQKYGNLQDVQNELSGKILQLAPYKMPTNYKVPFLSVGSDIGTREEMYKGASVYSGEFVIEDIKSDDLDYTLRRLVFLNNPNIIQSEAKLIQDNLKTKKSKCTPVAHTIVDRSYLSCNHHLVMSSSLQIISQDASVLLVGLGGGLLAGFIRKYFPKATVTAVDIDKAIVEVARKWFNFTDDHKLDVIINDGVQEIQNIHSKGSKYDIIMFDVDAKDRTQGLSCPPKAFVEVDLLKKVAQCLTPRGMFVLNLVCRDVTLKKSIVKDLKSAFNGVVSIDIPDEVNSIFFCQKIAQPPNTKDIFQKDLTDLNKYLKQQQKSNTNVVEIEELMSNLQVL